MASRDNRLHRCRNLGASIVNEIEGSNGPKKARGEEEPMCPACIASTAAMIAGAGSAGGILAVCIGRLFFRANLLGLFQKTKEK